MDWLDLLRRAKDEDTGEFLYAKCSPGSCVRSEREMERLIEAGEAIPAGGLIEFVGNVDGGIERRTHWDTSTATIETLFKNSANYCSKLRSLAPLPIQSVGEKTGSEAVSGLPSTEIAMDESGRPAEGPMEGAASGASATAAISAPKAEFQARSWNEVEISFFNEFSVEIRVGSTKAIHEFGRLGMASKRSGNPSLAWQTLHHLAISDGVISAPVGKKPNWGKVEKRMQELRAWLRSLFGLRSDPLPFVKGTGYRAQFAIKCAPSYKR
jgi:hypothetical protein